MKSNIKIKDIPGYNGFYQIDTKGNVYSRCGVGRGGHKTLHPRHLICQGTHPFGHKLAHIGGGTFYVHRLVLETFIGPCPKGMQARHLDNNPSNNNLDNLQWATVSVNQMDRVKFGTSNRGERCGSSKLTKTDVLEIRKRYKKDICSGGQLANEYHISTSTVWDILKRRIWRHI